MPRLLKMEESEKASEEDFKLHADGSDVKTWKEILSVWESLKFIEERRVFNSGQISFILEVNVFCNFFVVL